MSDTVQVVQRNRGRLEIVDPSDLLAAGVLNDTIQSVIEFYLEYKDLLERRLRGLIMALLGSAALTGCGEHASFRDVEETAEQRVCRTLSAGKYCFNENHVYSSGPEGFLLELPSRSLQGECNPKPEIDSIIRVLFGDYRMPSIGIDVGGARRTLVSKPEASRFFADAKKERFSCFQAPDQPERCDVDAIIDNGSFVSFSFYRSCEVEAVEYSAYLTDFLRGAQHAADN